MKAVQFFSDDYLKQCAQMTLEERMQYLEDFRLLMANVKDSVATKQPQKLISIKMPIDLLNAIKSQAKLNNTPYQTWMKKLLERALANSEP